MTDNSQLTDIFRFDVCRYKVALIMEILQAKKYLSRDQLYERNGNARLVVPLNERE